MTKQLRQTIPGDRIKIPLWGGEGEYTVLPYQEKNDIPIQDDHGNEYLPPGSIQVQVIKEVETPARKIKKCLEIRVKVCQELIDLIDTGKDKEAIISKLVELKDESYNAFYSDPTNQDEHSSQFMIYSELLKEAWSI